MSNTIELTQYNIPQQALDIISDYLRGNISEKEINDLLSLPKIEGRKRLMSYQKKGH
mgnify:CR=1 FL=1